MDYKAKHYAPPEKPWLKDTLLLIGYIWIYALIALTYVLLNGVFK